MQWWIIEKDCIDNAIVAISSKSNCEDMYPIVSKLKKC